MGWHCHRMRLGMAKPPFRSVLGLFHPVRLLLGPLGLKSGMSQQPVLANGEPGLGICQTGGLALPSHCLKPMVFVGQATLHPLMTKQADVHADFLGGHLRRGGEKVAWVELKCGILHRLRRPSGSTCCMPAIGRGCRFRVRASSDDVGGRTSGISARPCAGSFRTSRLVARSPGARHSRGAG